MTVAGYPSRGNDILGTVDTANGADGKPYTTINYANGKGISIGEDGKRVDVTLSQQFLNRMYLLNYYCSLNINFRHKCCLPSIHHSVHLFQ